MGKSQSKGSSRRTTDYLRGIAIIVVIASHYALSYQPDFYQKYLFEYASVILSIFFVLSGYGIFKSLDRRAPGGRFTRPVLVRFYFDRAFRIYLPLWAALLAITMFPAAAPMRELSLGTAGAWLGSPRGFWFVTAILQCYLVAPLLFVIYKKVRLEGFAALVLLFFFLSLAVSEWLGRRYGFIDGGFTGALMYRQYFLGNIVLFSLGMMIPETIPRLGKRTINIIMLVVSLGVFLAAMHYARHGTMYYAAFVLGAATFCMFMIAVRPPLPLSAVVGLLGRKSYPLYLFHRIYFMLLVSLGIIVEGSSASIVYALLLSPLLLGFCVALEKGVGAAYDWVTGTAMFVRLGSQTRPQDRLAREVK